MRQKTFWSFLGFYILYFFLLCTIGWLWEGLIYLFLEQRFVNRGVLMGPWLPIYGTGGVLLTLLLVGFKKHPIFVFLSSLLLCSTLEYFTSWALEAAWGIRWWNYDTHFCNLNGRICLWGSIGFGIGGLLLIYFLYPNFLKLYRKIPTKIRIALCIILLAFFLPDCIYALFSPQMGSGISEQVMLLYGIKIPTSQSLDF